ncbi:MAG: type II toxin-antitoxin system HicB family antitoxin [Nitrosotalea sp.]
MKYKIIIQKDEDGTFVANCPSLPGCISQGDTREEVLINIKDAARGYLQSLKKHDEHVHKAEEEPKAPKIAAASGVETIKELYKVGYDVDHQTGSHAILRQRVSPHERITVPNHKYGQGHDQGNIENKDENL